jgi:cell division protein FtsI/penicillin-binding protein 2
VGSRNCWRRREFCTNTSSFLFHRSLFASENVGSGTALLLRLRDRRLLVADGPSVAQRLVFPPGSTVKPFSLLALLESGRLTADEEYVCPQRLSIAGRSFNCSHPPLPLPMNVSRALAYSCNCAVAHFAERFRPGELSHSFQRSGLTSSVRSGLAGPDCLLQALGEEGVQVTAWEMLGAYRLASRVRENMVAPVVEGLEGAVEFGTAQAARLEKVRVAGKTGSVRTSGNGHGAWFAGFAPSWVPEVVVTVLVAGRSGGADAAPIAGRLLRHYFAGRA